MITATQAKALADASTTGRWRIALAGILRRIERRAKQGESSLFAYSSLLMFDATWDRVIEELEKLGYSVYGGDVSW